MKVTVHGPLARVDSDGVATSYAPDQDVEVDDKAKVDVEYFHNLAEAGLATITEDVQPKKPSGSSKEGDADGDEQGQRRARRPTPQR